VSAEAGSGVTLSELGGDARWPVAAEGELSIGRGDDQDVVLAVDGVSRAHARLTSGADGVFLRDATSANGTFIERRQKVIPVGGEVRLEDGDVIRMGAARLALGVPAAVDPTAAHPWESRIHKPTVAAGFCHFAVGFFVWALPAVLASDIAAEHGMSAIEAKILPATAIMFGAVARLVFGFGTDARGPLKSGSLALAVAMVALILLAALGNSVIVVWIAVAILGVGLASLPIALPLVSSRTAPERRGLALGIMASGSVGIVLAALAGPALADALDWRAVFGLALIPVTAGFGVFVFGARGEWRRPPTGAWRPMARGADLRAVAFLFGITFGTFAGLYTVLPSVLQAEEFALTRSEAALVVAMGALAGAVARVVGGSIADRIGSHRVLLAVMATTAVLLLVAGNVSLGLALAMFILSMALFDAGTSAVLKLAAQSFGRTVGAGVGIISAVGGLFGFGVSLIAGTLFESTDSSPATFSALAVAPAIAMVWMAVVVRRQGRAVPVATVPRLERLDPYGKPVEELPIGAELTIGRAPGNVLWLAADDFVSRSHARINDEEGRAVLTDLQSTNGTMLWRNGRWISVQQETLSEGDVIVVGSNLLRYRSGTDTLGATG
jgi:NNP family nitrate/nitrite transporter-like MFS transporter